MYTFDVLSNMDSTGSNYKSFTKSIEKLNALASQVIHASTDLFCTDESVVECQFGAGLNFADLEAQHSGETSKGK
jgi:hypothetical protein